VRARSCWLRFDPARAARFDARAAAHSRAWLGSLAGDVPGASALCGARPLRQAPVIDAFAARVRRAGAGFEQHEYPGFGHLFTDSGRPGYNAAASDRMFERVCDFVERLPPPGACR
jgi:dienelactone hydrolase